MAGKRYYSSQGYSGQRRGNEPADGLFGWTIFIFLLIGFVFLCWMGSYYIFARPEKATNYHLLQRLHKLEAPQRFEITAAPRGEFLKPGQLLERFGSMTAGEIRRANETLLRSFIRNYHQNRDLVPYAVGTYRVVGTLPLTQKTFCPQGLVALLQAVEQPEILLEQIFTANERNLPALKRALVPGQEIKLEKPLDLSAVVHIDRLPDNRISLTTMPLLYGSYGAGQGPTSFSLEPPSVLNLDTGLPVLTASQIGQLSGGTLAKSKGSTLSSRLTRIPEEEATPAPTPEPRVAKAIPVTTPLPEAPPSATTVGTTVERAIPVDTPAVLPAIPVNAPLPPATAAVSKTTIPKAIPVATSVATPAATPIAVVRATPTPTAPPKPIAAVTPPPTPAVATASVPPGTVPATNTAAALSTNTPSVLTPAQPWPVYAPGQMPRGQLQEASESRELAGHGIGKERHYLRGRFTVTASGNGKAVLRPQEALAGLPIGTNSKIRVIVEFPAGAEPPLEGNVISRDGQRPFLITSVKKGEDGQINVYAREITKGQ